MQCSFWIFRNSASDFIRFALLIKIFANWDRILTSACVGTRSFLSNAITITITITMCVCECDESGSYA